MNKYEELIAILRDEDNPNILDYIDEAADAIEKLQEYEDTGLEPEEITHWLGEMKTSYDENYIPYMIEATGSEAKHIFDLLQAEANGELVILPCKVGDELIIIGKLGICAVDGAGFKNTVLWEEKTTETALKEREMKTYITKEQAKSILPDGENIHTFYNAPFGLMGADWSRENIIDKIDKSEILELTGETARGMGHGMCAYQEDTTRYSDILFIQTDEDKLKELEAELERSKGE